MKIERVVYLLLAITPLFLSCMKDMPDSIGNVVVRKGGSGQTPTPTPSPETPIANQVVGSYTGTETLTVMGEAEESCETIEFTKATDVSVDMTLPKHGEGMMTVPTLPVKGITLTKSGNTITGKLAQYGGTVKSADGSEKTYTVSDVTVIFSDKTVVVTFTQKYSNMPFAFEGAFTGTRK